MAVRDIDSKVSLDCFEISNVGFFIYSVFINFLTVSCCQHT